MIYTIHVGPRAQEWPPQVDQATTREEARTRCKRHLGAAPATSTKGEVRLRTVLLDCFSRRQSGTIRLVYAAKQRNGDAAAVAVELPLEEAEA